MRVSFQPINAVPTESSKSNYSATSTNFSAALASASEEGTKVQNAGDRNAMKKADEKKGPAKPGSSAKGPDSATTPTASAPTPVAASAPLVISLPLQQQEDAGSSEQEAGSGQQNTAVVASGASTVASNHATGVQASAQPVASDESEADASEGAGTLPVTPATDQIGVAASSPALDGLDLNALLRGTQDGSVAADKSDAPAKGKGQKADVSAALGPVQTAAPVEISTVTTVPVAATNGFDMSSMLASGKAPAMEGDVKDAKGVAIKQDGVASKDSVGAKRKTDVSDANTGAASAKPDALVKVDQVVGAPGNDASAAQPDLKDMIGQQAAQTSVVPVATDASSPSHASQSASAGDVPAPAPSSPSTNPSTGDASGTDAVAMSAVSSARLIQSMHQSEMRLGMNSAEFGNISISTSVSHQSLTAQISLDHSELGQALSMHLPAIEAKLGSAYGLQARVEVMNGSATSQGDSSQQARENQQRGGGSSARSTMLPAGLASTAATLKAMPVMDTARLDIRI